MGGPLRSHGAWNTLVEQAVGDGVKAKTGGRSRALRAKAHPIAELDTAQEIRFPTGMGELDRVLGGGASRVHCACWRYRASANRR